MYPVPVSPLDVALARRLFFVGFEDDLISRFGQRRRLRGTQIEIESRPSPAVAVTPAASGIVVGYSDLLADQSQLKEYSYRTSLI